MQDKTWYSILGLDAEPLFLQDDMLNWFLLNKKKIVRFREWKKEKDYISILKRKGPNFGDDFCSSRVGRIFGKQYMYLNKNCFDYGKIIHTFSHAFGFLKENNHPDQEDYIQSQ